MSRPRFQVISDDDAQHFLDRGYVIIHDCFPREVAREWTDLAFKRLGYDPTNPATWEQPMVYLPDYTLVEVEEFSPKAWGAMCDLIGGDERQGGPFGRHWADCFIINFAKGAELPWEPPAPQVKGWHKDGDFFRHYLDSPEQGLLSIVLWSDILPQSGGTFLACDSISHVARHLLEHPEGLLPSGGFGELIHHCSDFVEITGKIGDVALIHPYMLHTASQNPSGRPRFITNPPVSLAAPMNFHRSNPDDYSLVEKATLQALGVHHLDFSPTGPRERIVPESHKVKQRLAEEQRARLAAGANP